MFLEIEKGTATKGTIFDFFRQYNVIEFKGTHDGLTLSKFLIQLGRVSIWASRHHYAKLEQILNIIVSAKYPREFLKYCEERGTKFQPVAGRKWLLEARCGLQDVVIVVCERLPIEPKYAIWLIFADPKTETWRETIKMLAKEQNWKLFDAAVELAPEEVVNMSTELDKIFAQYDYGPEHRAKVKRAKLTILKTLLPYVLDESPEDLELEEGTAQLLDSWTKHRLERSERNMVVRQLSRKLGQTLSPETEKQISELPTAQLTELGEALLDFTDLQDLINWLAANKQS